MRGIHQHADGAVELTDDDGTTTILMGPAAFQVASFYVSMKVATRDIPRCPLCQLPMIEPWEQTILLPIRVPHRAEADGAGLVRVTAHKGCWDDEIASQHDSERIARGDDAGGR